jgi:hypothetical protein
VYQPPAETLSSGAVFNVAVTGWRMLYYATDVPYKVSYHHHTRVYEKGTGQIRSATNSLTSITYDREDAYPVYASTPFKYRVSFTTATALRDGSSITLSFGSYTLPAGDEFFCTIDQPAYDLVSGIGCVKDGTSQILTITNLAAISAGSAIIVKTNLIHNGGTSDTVTITTKFGANSVDTGTASISITKATDLGHLRFDVDNEFRSRTGFTTENAPFAVTVTPVATYRVNHPVDEVKNYW